MEAGHGLGQQKGTSGVGGADAQQAVDKVVGAFQLVCHVVKGVEHGLGRVHVF